MKIIYDKNNITVYQGEAGSVNATLIEYPTHLVLIDSMYNSIDVKNLKNEILKRKKPLKYLINTHFHFDHFWGNKEITNKNTILFAHKNFIKTATTRVKSERERKILLKRNRYPDITFSDDIFLDDMHLFHTPGHTIDSICIHIAKSNILIAGDTILGKENNIKYPPYFVEGSINQMISTVEQIMQINFDTLIPGHFDVITKQNIEYDLNYLKNLLFNRKIDLPENKLIYKIHNDNKKNIKRW